MRSPGLLRGQITHQAVQQPFCLPNFTIVHAVWFPLYGGFELGRGLGQPLPQRIAIEPPESGRPCEFLQNKTGEASVFLVGQGFQFPLQGDRQRDADGRHARRPGV